MKTTVPGRMRIKKSILWKQVNDEVVIVDPGKNRYSYLNATGTVVWGMIAGGMTAEEMIDALCIRYAASREKITKDVDAIIAELRKAEIIEPLRQR